MLVAATEFGGLHTTKCSPPLELLLRTGLALCESGNVTSILLGCHRLRLTRLNIRIESCWILATLIVFMSYTIGSTLPFSIARWMLTCVQASGGSGQTRSERNTFARKKACVPLVTIMKLPPLDAHLLMHTCPGERERERPKRFSLL